MDRGRWYLWSYYDERWHMHYPAHRLAYLFKITAYTGIRPIAITFEGDNAAHQLEYYRDCSPDLIAALLKGKG